MCSATASILCCTGGGDRVHGPTACTGCMITVESNPKRSCRPKVVGRDQ